MALQADAEGACSGRQRKHRREQERQCWRASVALIVLLVLLVRPGVRSPCRPARTRCRTSCSLTRWRLTSRPRVPSSPVPRTLERQIDDARVVGTDACAVTDAGLAHLDEAAARSPHRRRLRNRGVVREKTDSRAARLRKGSCGGQPLVFDEERYTKRNTVEPTTNKLKQSRSVATRYDKPLLHLPRHRNGINPGCLAPDVIAVTSPGEDLLRCHSGEFPQLLMVENRWF